MDRIREAVRQTRAPLFAASATLALFSLAGCATTEPEPDPNRVSTIPWNRPQSWEGAGPLGGITPGPGGAF